MYSWRIRFSHFKWENILELRLIILWTYRYNFIRRLEWIYLRKVILCNARVTFHWLCEQKFLRWSFSSLMWLDSQDNPDWSIRFRQCLFGVKFQNERKNFALLVFFFLRIPVHSFLIIWYSRAKGSANNSILKKLLILCFLFSQYSDVIIYTANFRHQVHLVF